MDAIAGDDDAPPVPFDTTVAHQARMYDYFLGGKDNYAADRAAGDAWAEIDPDIFLGARTNRAFLGRVVRYLAAEEGIRQFLDIGSGIPTSGNTHQIAQDVAPESRVAYVDYDPVALAHSRALLVSSEAGATDYIDADLRDTSTVLTQAAKLLDFSQPVAITLMAVLHAIPDSDNPYRIVTTLLNAVPSGSFLALSHSASDLLHGEQKRKLEDVNGRLVHQDFTYRDREQVSRFFDGTELLEPGLVRVENWRPDPGDTGKSHLWGAVGRARLCRILRAIWSDDPARAAGGDSGGEMRSGSVLIAIWLIIGVIAAGQRGYYDHSISNCSQIGTILVTVAAGPLNYIGVNPKLGCQIPQPSQ